MIRLFIRLLPWGLAVFGAAWLVKGSFALSQKEETEPTQVTINALEAGERPDARWLEISGGYLFWLDSFRHVRVAVDEDGYGSSDPAEGNITQEVGTYVPLVSAQQADVWLNQNRNQRSYARCRAFVHFSNTTMKRKFPDVAAGQPNQLTTHYNAKGTVLPLSHMKPALRSKLPGQLNGISLSQTLLIHDGYRLASRGEVYTWLGFGLAMFVPGCLWIRHRRNKKRQAIKTASMPWGPRGVPRPPIATAMMTNDSSPTDYAYDSSYADEGSDEIEPEPASVSHDNHDSHDDAGDESSDSDD